MKLKRLMDGIIPIPLDESINHTVFLMVPKQASHRYIYSARA
jgi:hypothetical protein